MFNKKSIYLLLIGITSLGILIIANNKIATYHLLSEIKNRIIYPTKEPTYQDSRLAIKPMEENVVDACQKPTKNTTYSFFVAGHTYGDPSNYDQTNGGIYPAFIKGFHKINKCESMIYGFLLGDIVRESSYKSFKLVKSDLQLINPKISTYIVPGNHDVGIGKNNVKRDIFIQNFGKTYDTFEHGEDLFILLDANLDNWNILNDQLKILENLINNGRNYHNVFIFTHQVIWYNANNSIFAKVEPNSWEGYSDITNFWNEVFPVISKIGKKIYLFAGDVGAFSNNSEFFYAKHDNVQFFATGMGGGERDNFLIASVINGTVNVALIPLNEISNNKKN